MAHFEYEMPDLETVFLTRFLFFQKALFMFCVAVGHLTIQAESRNHKNERYLCAYMYCKCISTHTARLLNNTHLGLKTIKISSIKINK